MTSRSRGSTSKQKGPGSGKDLEENKPYGQNADQKIRNNGNKGIKNYQHNTKKNMQNNKGRH